MVDFPEPGPRRRPAVASSGSAVLDHVAAARRPRRAAPAAPDVLTDRESEAIDRVVESTIATLMGVPEEVLAAVPDDAAREAAEDRRRFVEGPLAAAIDAAEKSLDEVLANGDRPTRAHANAKYDRTAAMPRGERRFDKTALHAEGHGRSVSHADYIAHCERYDYAFRSIKKGDRILDVGCGTDAALMYAIIYSHATADKVLRRAGGCYVGIDLNKLKPTGIAWATLIGEVDLTSEAGYDAALRAIPGNAEALAEEADDYGRDPDDDVREVRGYSLIVAFEILEHMQPEDGRRLLENMRDLLSPDGRILLSTPVFNGAQAANHVHEYEVQELKDLIEDVGLVVERRMGTFTAEPVLKRYLKANRPDWLKLYEEARAFHSSGYMSGVLAPMLPDFSRNNLWDLRRPSEER